MTEICGTCLKFTPDEDYKKLFGFCSEKGRYVAFYSICDIKKYKKTEVLD